MAATAEKFIFLTGEGYRIYSSIYSASAEEKFLTGRGEYIIYIVYSASAEEKFLTENNSI